jgi:hypothetical protein
LARVADEKRLPIVIHGKSYKAGVPYTDGSYSLLIAHFLNQAGHDINWVDPQTGDTASVTGPAVVLLAHDPSVSYPNAAGLPDGGTLYAPIAPGSVVVDPWRKFKPDGVEVIHFGNTRQPRQPHQS